MKLILKIVAGLLVLFLLLLAGLNLYLTDERLRDLVLPQLRETLDREVEIDRLSLTFFRTLPRFGLQMEGFRLADEDQAARENAREEGSDENSSREEGDAQREGSEETEEADGGRGGSGSEYRAADGEPAISFERLIAAVRLFPLIRSEIAISRLELDSPRLWFRIYEDGTTNYDSLMADDTEPELEEEEESGYTLQIPKFVIRNAAIYYRDASSG